jgi:hypothetical protein
MTAKVTATAADMGDRLRMLLALAMGLRGAADNQADLKASSSSYPKEFPD